MILLSPHLSSSTQRPPIPLTFPFFFFLTWPKLFISIHLEILFLTGSSFRERSSQGRFSTSLSDLFLSFFFVLHSLSQKLSIFHCFFKVMHLHFCCKTWEINSSWTLGFLGFWPSFLMSLDVLLHIIFHRWVGKFADSTGSFELQERRHSDIYQSS